MCLGVSLLHTHTGALCLTHNISLCFPLGLLHTAAIPAQVPQEEGAFLTFFQEGR